jgi:subtilisin family serine protease
VTTEINQIPGLSELWADTLGDPAITIAVLDGSVDLSHPCFAGALVTPLPGVASRCPAAGDGPMTRHGTHVASMIFGRASGGVTGIAPGCRGLIVPIYSDEASAPTSQRELAHGINQALAAGAHVINISAGELSETGEADSILLSAVRDCHHQGVLIVAAAGNDGCRCLHVPAAIPTVLAVGAADENGNPLESSNWGDAYRAHGVLAPGRNMLGAAPGGGLAQKSGTSFATAVVTGVVGLLLSVQRKRGAAPEPLTVRAAILETAISCEGERFAHRPQCLVGRLNVPGAHALIAPFHLRHTQMFDERSRASRVHPGDISQPAAACSSGLIPQEEAGTSASDIAPRTVAGASTGATSAPVVHAPDSGQIGAAAQTSGAAVTGLPQAAPSMTGRAGDSVTEWVRGIVSSGDGSCSCGAAAAVGAHVFALGVLGYDFGTEARRDTFASLMPDVHPSGMYPFVAEAGVSPLPPNPHDPRQMVNYLAGFPRPQPPFPNVGGYPKLAPPMFAKESLSAPAGYPGYEASPWDAAELIWTLNIELTPIYAIRPSGGFAADTFQRLVSFLDGQNRSPQDEAYVERICIPGHFSGETVRLFSGQVVPVVVPSLRGMFGWNITALSAAALSKVKERTTSTARSPEEVDKAMQNVRDGLRNFLDRVYHDLRNLGVTSAERALNFAATNAFQSVAVLADAASRGMELDTITTERSAFCRKDSDCWDVKLRFYDPHNVLSARLVSRFTVDVSDIYPVLVGPVRTWSEAGSLT